MDHSPIDRLWIASDGVETVWTVLWLVLAAITVTLVLLMYTRWGRSRPLEKCALLSLLAHALLAGICTSVQLAAGVQGVREQDAPLALAALDSEFADSDASDSAAPDEPWDSPADSPAFEPVSTLDRRLAADSPTMVRQASATSDAAAMLRPHLEMPHTPQPDETAASESHAPRATRASAEPIAPSGNVARAADAPAIVDGVASPQPRRQASDDAIVDRTAAEPATPSALESLAGTPDRSVRPALPVPSDLDAPALPRRGAIGDETTASPTPGEIGGTSLAPPSVLPAVTGVGGARSGAATANGGGETPDIYKARSAPNRAQIAAAGGGSAETEAAVDRALAWLAANQSADGRWDVARLEGGLEPRTAGHDRQGAGVGADTGVTGLALLAFLGRGHTHLQGDYRDTVRRGLEFLLNAQDQRGSVEGDARLFAKMYCHGMGALALSEAYAMTGDDRLKNAVRDAVAFTSAAQHTVTGGWRYLPAQPGDTSPGSLGDMSQHGWQVMILKSAQLAGIEPGDVVLTRAAKFVTSTASGKHGGLSSYRPRERVTATMTAEALVCRWFLGMSRGEALDREAGDQLLAELPSADAPNFYYWYYGTLAMHEIQGEDWGKWNEAMQRTLLATQRRGGRSDGSWDPDPVWGGYGGRTYSTALGALSLEVYYRYLPLYKPAETARRDKR